MDIGEKARETAILMQRLSKRTGKMTVLVVLSFPAERDARVLIGAAIKRVAITATMVGNLPDDAIVVDAGIGTIDKEAAQLGRDRKCGKAMNFALKDRCRMDTRRSRFQQQLGLPVLSDGPDFEAHRPLNDWFAGRRCATIGSIVGTFTCAWRRTY